jgi:amino acid adenylation domain-containing protein
MTDITFIQQFLQQLAADNIRLHLTSHNELAVRGDKQLLSAQRLAQLKALKPEIIAWLSQQQATAATVPVVDRSAASYPLSYAQQRLWFIDTMTGPDPQYNMFSAFTIKGALQPALLAQAVQTLVQRHEILRTLYLDEQGEPRQRLLASAEVAELALLNFVTAAQVQQQAAALGLPPRAWLDAELMALSQQPFILSTELPLRCHLFELAAPGATGDGEYLLLFVLHHIACDEWSFSVASQDLMLAYQQAQGLTTAALPQLSVQYLDYASWQQSYLHSQSGSQAAAYFRQLLIEAPEVHNLPTDYRRPMQQQFAGAVAEFCLPLALSQQLQQLAQQQQVTLFGLLEAAFALLMLRLSGDQELLIGTPVAGRHQPELQSLIGFFVNTLVLRHRADWQQSFVQFLQQQQHQLKQSFQHQEYPFDLLVEQLRPQRSLSYSPLVQLVFTMLDNQAPSLRLAGLQLQPYPLTLQSAKFDLSLACLEQPTGIRCFWNYATTLFSADRITAFQHSFLALLQGIVAQPSAPMATLPLLSDEQYRQQLQRCASKTPACVISQTDVVSRFDQMASQQPQQVAVRDAALGQQLSFADLQAQSERLTQALLTAGVRSGDRVGLYLDRSVAMVVAMLGILRAGAAYVPLDIDNPPSRTRYILADSAPTVLLSRQALQADLAPLALTCPVLWLDALPASNSSQPWPQLQAGQLAYIIYTSGSTGEPKGVMVSHRNILTLIAATNFYQPQPGDVLAQCANHAFDAATFEIWSALLHGLPTCIISREQLLDAEVFSQTLAQQQVNVLFLSSGIFNQLVQHQPAIFARMKLVAFGGDAAEIVTINQVVRHGKPEHFYNIYGPTETTTFSCFYRIEQQLEEAPIGLPLAGHGHYVLDAQQQLLPDGVIGELYIAGAALADGYWQRPELTAASFVSVSLAGQLPQRLYKTGDLVRVRADGQLCYVGRVDKQVKIRGFRVELAEIVSTLQQLPEVSEALVVVAGQGVHKRLAAYICPARQYQGSHAQLIALCQATASQQLPDYMQPLSYQCLAALPLNVNGKVDLRALPEPSFASDSYQAPETAIEQWLQQLWSELLQLPATELGIDRNFFTAGGHSLLATRLQSRISRELDIRLNIRSFFDYPTIRQLAQQLTAPQQQRQFIRRYPELEPAPLSYPQQRLWFIDQLQGVSTEYHMPVAMRLTGLLQADALQYAVDQLVSRHSMLRTCYQLVGEQAVQQCQPARPVPVQWYRLSAAPAPAELQQQLLEKISQPFDLQKDLMLKVWVWQWQQDEHVLLFNLHHIACDGWSLDILTQEFMQYYAAYLQADQTALPADLAISYADYAHWQQQTFAAALAAAASAESVELAEQISFWQQQLADLPAVHHLPLDFARPAQRSFAGQNVELTLPAELSAALRQFASRQDMTLFMLLESMFALLLARWSDDTDIVIGTPVAARPYPEVQGLVGFFVNTLVLRQQVDLDWTADAYLQRQKQQLLLALSQQDLPFDLLVDILKPARSLSYSPLFQVSFAVQAAGRPELTLPGLTIQGVALAEQTSKFDLNLTVIDQGAAGLHCIWQYASSLFRPQTIRSMASSFQQLLQSLLRTPTASLKALALTDSSQLTPQALGHGPAYQAPQPELVHQAFSAQARLTPDAVAVVSGAEQLSYLQLEQRANQLAHLLRQAGVVAGSLVPLYVQRSADMVVGMLAILKAGAAYVPLDTSYPAHRLSYMLQDTAASLVLTEQALAGSLAELGPYQAICLDQSASLSNQPVTAPAEPWSAATALAYVIYTSGSTGQPKGVMVSHQGIRRLCTGCNYVQLTASDVVAQSSNHSFDAATFEIWAPLLAGASLVIVAKECLLDPNQLRDCIRQQRISVLFVTTALFNQLVYASPDLFAPLSYLLFGGEAVDNRAVDVLLTQGKPAQLLHMYGPTENTTFSTFFPISTAQAEPYPIGKSISGSTHYVLDRHLQLVPAGAIGELYVGGAGLALGYLNQPALTAAAFIAHPFAPDQMLYKTGDLVRLNSQGDICYLGRRDHQVKWRGFRIELAEIEQCLLQVDGVDQVVVALSGEEPHRRLVAWLGSQLPAEALCSRAKATLGSLLPGYMQPSQYLVQARLVLNANGKIDRKALPVPELLPVAADFQPAVTATEQQLAQLWQSLFGLDAISIHSNFFDLGGHSILATRLVAQIQQQLGVSLNIRDLFEYQTISALAGVIDAGSGQDSQPALRQRFSEMAAEGIEL